MQRDVFTPEEVRALEDLPPGASSSRPEHLMERASILVQCDCAQLWADVDEIRQRIERAPEWMRWLVLQVLEASSDGVELVQVDADDAAACRTGVARIRPQLAERLRRLLFALRASQGERELGVFGE